MGSRQVFFVLARGAESLLLLSLGFIACIAVLALGSDDFQAAAAQPASQSVSSAARSPAGPPDTDFNSQGFRITKVVRMEQELNALGISAQFSKTNKVGKYVELPKRLEFDQRGEHFIVTWKYTGKADKASASEAKGMLLPEKATLKFEYKLSNEEHLETITKEYAPPAKGGYCLRIENVGMSYRQRGYLEYWQVSVFADGKLVARKRSFLWPLFQGDKDTKTQLQDG